jgi:hypothetical protein
MRENANILLKMDKGSICLLLEVCTKESGWMGGSMVLDGSASPMERVCLLLHISYYDFWYDVDMTFYILSLHSI